MANGKKPKRKLALVIGNDNYRVEPFRSCLNDAEDISNKLRNIHFDVTLRCDLTHTEMLIAIDEFMNKITEEDLVVFYFSGHGRQYKKTDPHDSHR